MYFSYYTSLDLSRRPLGGIDHTTMSLDRRLSSKKSKKRRVTSATTVEMQRSYQDIHVCFTGTDQQRQFPKHNLIFHGVTTTTSTTTTRQEDVNNHDVGGKSSPRSVKKQIVEGKWIQRNLPKADNDFH